MSDTPTLYRRVPVREDKPGRIAAWGYVPVTEPLLTREEAANDTEVQRIVIREWKNNAQWSGSSDHTGRER